MRLEIYKCVVLTIIAGLLAILAMKMPIQPFRVIVDSGKVKVFNTVDVEVKNEVEISGPVDVSGSVVSIDR